MSDANWSTIRFRYAMNTMNMHMRDYFVEENGDCANFDDYIRHMYQGMEQHLREKILGTLRNMILALDDPCNDGDSSSLVRRVKKFLGAQSEYVICKKVPTDKYYIRNGVMHIVYEPRYVLSQMEPETYESLQAKLIFFERVIENALNEHNFARTTLHDMIAY